MTRLFTILILLISGYPTFSQITITNSTYGPVAGDSVVYNFADTTNVREGMSSSAAGSWNFSTLRFTTGIERLYYKKASATPYAGAFPTANLAMFDSTINTYVYFRADSSKVFKLGEITNADTQRYQDSELIFTYPFGYGGSSADSFEWQDIKSGKSVDHFGYISRSGDAFGSLALANGTFQNVLRVRTYETIMNVNHNPTGLDTDVVIHTTYSYFVPNEKWPVMEIIYYTLGGGTVKTVRFYPATARAGIAPSDNGRFMLFTYPNPAEETTNILLTVEKTAKAEITLLNAQGQKVKEIYNQTMAAGEHTLRFDRNDLKAGVYLLSTRIGNSMQTQKIVLK